MIPFVAIFAKTGLEPVVLAWCTTSRFVDGWLLIATVSKEELLITGGKVEKPPRIPPDRIAC